MLGLRRLYDWVLSWADSRFGGIALFVLAFAESVFFPIPPDVLLIALAIAAPLRSLRFAAIAASGSVLGGMVGYALGLWFWELSSPFFYGYIPGFTAEHFTQVQQLFAAYDFLVVFSGGFTPIPYKVITVGAGVFQINFAVFVLASMVGRSLRFFLVAWFIRCYGPSVRRLIEQYFNFFSLAFFVLLILGFWVLKYLLA